MSFDGLKKDLSDATFTEFNLERHAETLYNVWENGSIIAKHYLFDMGGNNFEPRIDLIIGMRTIRGPKPPEEYEHLKLLAKAGYLNEELKSGRSTCESEVTYTISTKGFEFLKYYLKRKFSIKPDPA